MGYAYGLSTRGVWHSPCSFFTCWKVCSPAGTPAACSDRGDAFCCYSMGVWDRIPSGMVAQLFFLWALWP